MKKNQSTTSSRLPRERRVSYALCVLFGLMAVSHGSMPTGETQDLTSAELTLPDDGRGTPYKVNKSDNLCGLSEPRQLSDPAKVDYPALLQATDEYREMRAKKIDPQSARGIDLHNKAHSRIIAACERARASRGHCSVWKAINRRNGKAVSDLTKVVKRDLACGV